MMRVAEEGWNLGQFRAVPVRIAETWGALRMKIVSTTAEQAIWAYNPARFRSQNGNLC
jgi:hypothetical protein